MSMNVRPIPSLDPRINEIRLATAEIVNQHIIPNETKLWAAFRRGPDAEPAEREEARSLRRERGGQLLKSLC